MRLLRCLLLLPISLLLATTAAATAGPLSAVSQRDLMVNLVDSLGLSFGLPDEPTDADYLRILSGRRHLRVEAEDHHLPTDMISVNSFQTFGPFSGKAWVNGIAVPTKTHLNFFLPLPGRYRVSASVRSGGHVFTIAGAKINVPAGDQKFHTVELGSFDLTAGETTIPIDLPPNASIDYLELDAPPLLPIEPRGGWQPDAPLENTHIATCIARALTLEGLLPASGSRQTIEAETALVSGSVESTDIRHLGAPSGGSWLRAGVAAASVTLRFTPSTAGVYDLVVRGEGEQPVRLLLDDHYPLQANFPPYLDNVTVITIFLDAVPHTLEVELPGRAGIDALFLAERRSDDTAYLRLTGFPGNGPPAAEEINRALAMTARLRPPQ